MRSWRRRVKRLLNERGWELRRLYPDTGIDTYLSFLLRQLRVNCVIDVGARHGDFVQLMRWIGYEGRVVSFEPVSSSMREMERRFAADPRWRGYQTALGSATAHMPINVTVGTNFSSLRAPNNYGQEHFPGIAVAGQEEVRVQRLDELIGEVIAGILDPRVYLKIDTQGWDLEVLRGAARCLDLVVGAQAEMSILPVYEDMPSYSEAISEFRDAGFDVSAMFPVTRDDDLRLVEFDCVFVRHPSGTSSPAAPERATAVASRSSAPVA